MRRLMTALGLLAVLAGAVFAAAPTYTEAETQLGNVASDIVASGNLLAGAAQQVIAADNVLAALPTTYAALIAEINAQATAAPADTAWGTLKARLGKMVADYTALKAKSAVAKDAFAAIETHGAAAVAAKLAELDQ